MKYISAKTLGGPDITPQKLRDLSKAVDGHLGSGVELYDAGGVLLKHMRPSISLLFTCGIRSCVLLVSAA